MKNEKVSCSAVYCNALRPPASEYAETNTFQPSQHRRFLALIYQVKETLAALPEWQALGLLGVGLQLPAIARKAYRLGSAAIKELGSSAYSRLKIAFAREQ